MRSIGRPPSVKREGGAAQDVLDHLELYGSPRPKEGEGRPEDPQPHHDLRLGPEGAPEPVGPGDGGVLEVVVEGAILRSRTPVSL